VHAPNRFRRHRREAIAAFLLLAAFAIDSGGATLYDLVRDRAERKRQELAAERDQQRLDLESDESRYRTTVAEYHHDLQPNKSVERASWAGLFYPVRTNSLGFRDAAVRDVPLARHPRLLLIGDSFTEGVGVRYEDTFAAHLEEELGKEGVSVLNAGVASYSPSIYYRKVKYLIEQKRLEFDTLAVFLDLSDIHDESVWYDDVFWKNERPEPSPTAPAPARKENAPASLEPPPIDALPAEDPDVSALTTYERTTRFLWRHSLLARGAVALKLALTGGAVPIRAVGATGSPRSRWTVDRTLFEQYGRTGLRRCALAMDQLAALTKARGIELILVVYPWPDQIDTRDLDSIHVRFWRAWAEKEGVLFFDLFPVFINGESKFEVYEKYFIRADAHWNAAGHALVAREFLKRYRARGR
jgi:hypothetical protein